MLTWGNVSTRNGRKATANCALFPCLQFHIEKRHPPIFSPCLQRYKLQLPNFFASHHSCCPNPSESTKTSQILCQLSQVGEIVQHYVYLPFFDGVGKGRVQGSHLLWFSGKCCCAFHVSIEQLDTTRLLLISRLLHSFRAMTGVEMPRFLIVARFMFWLRHDSPALEVSWDPWQKSLGISHCSCCACACCCSEVLVLSCVCCRSYYYYTTLAFSTSRNGDQQTKEAENPHQ